VDLTPEALRRRRLLQIVGAVVAVATVAILLRALLTPAAPAPHTRASGTPSTGIAVGSVAPDVTLLDLTNKRVPLSSLRGSVVVLNFWYVACDPCRYEMPALQKIYDQEKGQGLVVVGVNIADDAQTISTFIQQLGISYPIYRDLGQRATLTYQLVATPSSFILDRHGVIRFKILGTLDRNTLTQDTAPLLAEK
jgi:peroxiredoxin